MQGPDQFPFSSPEQSDWNNFLQREAFRGHKINRASKYLKRARKCAYDAQNHRINLITKSGKTININVAKIDNSRERWSLSRCIHERRMKNAKYAQDFNNRIESLAKCLTPQKPNDPRKGASSTAKHLTSQANPQSTCLPDSIPQKPVDPRKSVSSTSDAKSTSKNIDDTESSSESIAEDDSLFPLPFLRTMDSKHLAILSKKCDPLSKISLLGLTYNYNFDELMKDPSLTKLRNLYPSAVEECDIMSQKLDILINFYNLVYRVKRLKVIPSLTMFLFTWEHSSLRYMLMMNDELQEIKLSEIEDMGPIGIHSVVSRILQLARKQKAFDQSPRNDSDISSLALVDIPRLDASTIHQLAKNLPAWVFYFISPKEVPHLDVTKLTNNQLNCLFEENAQAFKKHQIDLCLNRVNLHLLQYLSDKQIIELDFTLIDQPIFHAIFSKYQDRTKNLLHKCSIDQLTQIQTHFTQWYWSALTDDQFLKLDFTLVNDRNFVEMFPTFNDQTKQRLQKCSIDKLKQIQKHFKQWHWSALTDDQFLKLDFTLVNDRNSVEMFPTFNDQTKQRLQKCSIDELKQIQKHFKQWHWSALTDDQFIQLDFTLVNDGNFVEMFPTFNDQTKQRLQKCSIANLKQIQKHFKQWHWGALTDDQFLKLDFTLVNDGNFVEMFPTFNDQTKQRLQKCSIAKLKQIQKHFKQWHWDALTNEQRQALKTS